MGSASLVKRVAVGLVALGLLLLAVGVVAGTHSVETEAMWWLPHPVSTPVQCGSVFSPMSHTSLPPTRFNAPPDKWAACRHALDTPTMVTTTSLALGAVCAVAGVGCLAWSRRRSRKPAEGPTLVAASLIATGVLLLVVGVALGSRSVTAVAQNTNVPPYPSVHVPCGSVFSPLHYPAMTISLGLGDEYNRPAVCELALHTPRKTTAVSLGIGALAVVGGVGLMLWGRIRRPTVRNPAVAMLAGT